MKKIAYKIRLVISKQIISSQDDIVSLTYIIYAPDRDSALDGACQLAAKEFYGYMVLSTQIEPMDN
jgi:hypothetical protein